MGEKIFGEMKTEDLNELANNLRKAKEFDEIRQLCKENDIPGAVAEKFIKGEQLILVERGYRKRHLFPCKTTMKEKAPEYTVEDVRKKLEAELEIYKDGDSKYVVKKLIERCEREKDLLNAIMLPHKSYEKAFQYFYERSRTVGYKMPHGNMVYLDNDRAVELSVEYFKKDDKTEKKVAPPKEKPKQKAVSKKLTGEAKKAEASVPADIKEPEKAKQQTKANKKEIAGQMSLFDF